MMASITIRPPARAIVVSDLRILLTRPTISSLLPAPQLIAEEVGTRIAGPVKYFFGALSTTLNAPGGREVSPPAN